VLDGETHKLVPILPSGNPEQGLLGTRITFDSLQSNMQNKTGEAFVRNPEIAPSAKDKDGKLPLVSKGKGFNNIRLGGGLSKPSGRAAYPKSGPRRESNIFA
jgi:hypothetical protein